MPSRDWSRLARYVLERRDELGLTQEEVATRGGPSTATLRLIEGGEPGSYRPKSLRQLADGLGWTPDSPLAILNGREPHLASESRTEQPALRRDEPPPRPARNRPAGNFPGDISGESPAQVEASAWDLIAATASPRIPDLATAIRTPGADIFADPVLAEIWDMDSRSPLDRLMPMIVYVIRQRHGLKDADRTA